ncbi:IclR family transcriptional regulator domain-containing protein [Streptomyces sp. NPDC001595]|uniref:IclR family transcriptional regulator domain-containing protein n=1 Tax=Streptomyces sp. NPDC001532 TaxID=3154520 RepID=UPI00332D9462
MRSEPAAGRAGHGAQACRCAGDEAIVVLGVESAHELRRAARLGAATPLHRGCGGQAILAHLPAREIIDLLERVPQHADMADVEESLGAVRAQGFALSEGADHPGLTGVAAPVLTPSGRPAASVAVSGPSGRWTPARAREFADVLTQHCARQRHARPGHRAVHRRGA